MIKGRAKEGKLAIFVHTEQNDIFNNSNKNP
jgi:hypothetical protein